MSITWQFKNMKKVAEFLTQEECGVLLKMPNRKTQQGKRDYAMLKLMLNTGLRKQEVCNLKVGDIKVHNNQFCLLVNGKGNKERRQPIGKTEILEAIKDYRKHLKDSDPNSPLFMTLAKYGPWKKKPITPVAVDGMVRKYAKMALIKKRITPHSLRHTFCTMGLRQGIDLMTMKNLMGHSSIQSTQVYLHSDEERKFEAVKKLSFA